MICANVKEFREASGLTRIAFARLLGSDSTTLANIERGRSRVTYPFARRLLMQFPELSPRWLAERRGWMLSPSPRIQLPESHAFRGGGAVLFSFVYDSQLKQDLTAVMSGVILSSTVRKDEPPIPEVCFGDDADGRSQALGHLFDITLRSMARIRPGESGRFIARFREALNRVLEQFELMGPDSDSLATQLRARLRQLIADGASVPNSQAMLDNQDAMPDCCGVPQIPANLEDLMARVRAAVSDRGAKSGLAKHLGVSRQAVDQWLAGSTSPSAQTTLRLVAWLSGAQKQNGRGDAPAPPQPETRSDRKHENSPKSGPP
jgi:transcriptional regulator with XRE-family HTH domain